MSEKSCFLSVGETAYVSPRNTWYQLREFSGGKLLWYLLPISWEEEEDVNRDFTSWEAGCIEEGIYRLLRLLDSPSCHTPQYSDKKGKFFASCGVLYLKTNCQPVCFARRCLDGERHKEREREKEWKDKEKKEEQYCRMLSKHLGRESFQEQNTTTEKYLSHKNILQMFREHIVACPVSASTD